jgi:hypothetical protein
MAFPREFYGAKRELTANPAVPSSYPIACTECPRPFGETSTHRRRLEHVDGKLHHVPNLARQHILCQANHALLWADMSLLLVTNAEGTSTRVRSRPCLPKDSHAANTTRATTPRRDPPPQVLLSRHQVGRVHTMSSLFWTTKELRNL